MQTSATIIGSKASEILASGFAGRVIASGSSALYIRGEQGHIIGVAGARQPAHIRFVLASDTPSDIQTGAKTWSDRKNLRFDDGTVIEFLDARVWRGRGPNSFKVIPVEHLDVRAALRGAMSLHSGQNLGLSLKLMYCRSDETKLDSRPSVEAGFKPAPTDATHPSYEAAFIQSAIDCIRVLAESCSRGSIWADLETAKSLVGLGPGLTPSGDDFLGGLFFVLWHLNSAYPSQFGYDTESIDSLLEYASSQTNQISHAILTDFAVGQGPLPLHDLMEALLTGKPTSSILDWVQRVAEIGHSSGWDMLAGFRVGMTTIDDISAG